MYLSLSISLAFLSTSSIWSLSSEALPSSSSSSSSGPSSSPSSSPVPAQHAKSASTAFAQQPKPPEMVLKSAPQLKLLGKGVPVTCFAVLKGLVLIAPQLAPHADVLVIVKPAVGSSSCLICRFFFSRMTRQGPSFFNVKFVVHDICRRAGPHVRSITDAATCKPGIFVCKLKNVPHHHHCRRHHPGSALQAQGQRPLALASSYSDL